MAAFESRLDEVWKNQPVRFNYKEELQLQSTDVDIEEDLLRPVPSMMMMMSVTISTEIRS